MNKVTKFPGMNIGTIMRVFASNDPKDDPLMPDAELGAGGSGSAPRSASMSVGKVFMQAISELPFRSLTKEIPLERIAPDQVASSIEGKVSLRVGFGNNLYLSRADIRNPSALHAAFQVARLEIDCEGNPTVLHADANDPLVIETFDLLRGIAYFEQARGKFEIGRLDASTAEMASIQAGMLNLHAERALTEARRNALKQSPYRLNDRQLAFLDSFVDWDMMQPKAVAGSALFIVSGGSVPTISEIEKLTDAGDSVVYVLRDNEVIALHVDIGRLRSTRKITKADYPYLDRGIDDFLKSTAGNHGSRIFLISSTTDQHHEVNRIDANKAAVLTSWMGMRVQSRVARETVPTDSLVIVSASLIVAIPVSLLPAEDIVAFEKMASD